MLSLSTYTVKPLPMSALFAFLHHAAAFSLVAMLVVELFLIRQPLTLPLARAILRADMLFGISSGVLLVVGFARVSFFEKGGDYYVHSAPFIAKLALFVAVGLLSVYPTIVFLSWRKAVSEGRLPEVGPHRLKVVRTIIHAELAGVFFILLCAALMAKGVGVFG